ncbi:unnamed protein product, partial [Brenthis ino]
MGEYISKWLQKEKLLPKDCPNELAFVYANTRQRTRESAKAFVRGAFNCNVTVHTINSEIKDPIFNPIFRNESKVLKSIIMNEMQVHLDQLQLEDSYELLENILDLKNSLACKDDGICSFKVKDQIFYAIGEEPNLIGPLQQSNAIVDSFFMDYYEGLPMKDIAWGKIKNNEDWKLLAKITRENLNVRFNGSTLSKEVAKPLLGYLKNIFEKESVKFALLHGHDANLISVMTAIGFKGYVLPDQYESTPLGGKLVFQKWSHKDIKFLKVHYVYQTVEQLREGIKLSEINPPRWVEMEIVGCPKDKNEFCLWDDFMNIMRSL